MAMKGHDALPRARKRFGQNFLQDMSVIDRIIAAIDPRPGQRLVEIGPGRGALTIPLLRALGRLDVVEFDRDLVAWLGREMARHGELVVHQADALAFDFRALAAGTPLRVAGNLPYNISTPLLFHLFAQADAIVDMHFMLQKEVVDRLAADPGSRTYGRLSVMAQYHCRVVPLFDVPPHAFRPAPKVDSSVVRLVPHAAPPVQVDDYTALQKVVTTAFMQRRKTLRNGLRELLDAAQIRAAGIDPTLRAERLSLADFAALANRLSAAG